MAALSVAIPFERQENLQTHRGCGAACLSMVYKSFGKDVPQGEIWPLIAKQNRFGSIASTTHLMALHAIRQGLSAVIVQARHPLQVLRLCHEAGIRAIINQRPHSGVQTGHYTVLVDMDQTSVVLHDPDLGPFRRMSHAELLRLWQPQCANAEILGSVIVGIAAEPGPIPACEFCHTAIPAKVDCPKCRKGVGLNPAVLLGCIRDGCIARMWNYVACPSCDYVWSFNEAGMSNEDVSGGDVPRAADPQKGPSFPQPQNLDGVFAELDKFCAQLLTVPGAAKHADLNTQLKFIQTSKNMLRLAQVEELAAAKVRVDKLVASEREAKQKQQLRRQKQEELNAPMPPLDGNALGESLLKNLGLK
jgi:Peptidase C39 family